MGEFSIAHLAILGIILFGLILFPLIAIIDVANSTNKNKALWIALIFFMNFIGAAVYWLIGRKPKSPNAG